MCDVLDIVLQGPANSYTLSTAEHYLELNFVNNVIVSCWIDDNVETKNPRIKIIKNACIENPGPQNCNCQIKTSLEGLKHVTTNFAIKFRSDIRVYLDSMIEMYNFYNKNKDKDLTYFNNVNKPNNKIGVLAVYKDFPFHPHDQIFFGNTEDLIELFTIPYSEPNKDCYLNFNDIMRAEAYIAVHYFAKFDNKINKFIENKKKYLVDNAPNIDEALELSDRIMDRIFKVFPKINHEWPKYSPDQYSYETRKKCFKGFYWHTS